jgi:hypothetical protein
MPARRRTTPGLILGGAVLCVLVAGCAATPEQLRVAYHATNVADAGATLARDPACMSEGNPLLGSDPPDSAVLGYMVLQGLIYEGIFRHIRDHDEADRLAFGRVFLGLKVLTVGWNAALLARGCP